MNKTSTYKNQILMTILLILFIVGAIISYSLKSVIVYGFILWSVGCLFVIIQNFLLYDIDIHDNIVELKNMIRKKNLEMSKLQIFDVKVVRGPIFILDTNFATMRVNYTRVNYNWIIQLLELKKYKNVEIFQKKIRTSLYFLKD